MSGLVQLPNILVTGTPGTGKTTTAQLAAERTGLRYINVGDVVKERMCHEGRDEEFDTYILDEEKLCDELEEAIRTGGNIIDFHSPEIFPEDWFDLVLVLRTSTEQLFDRLSERGYNEKKRNENMECEIMQVVLEAAKESYEEHTVHELASNTIEDMESNVNRVEQWLQNWKRDNGI